MGDSGAVSCARPQFGSETPLARLTGPGYFYSMSAVEIIAELPKLTDDERSAVRRRLRELDERDEAQFLHESADAMFRDLDQLEAENARGKTR